jgi:hypothetical protein
VANPERKLRCLYRLVEDGMTEMEIGQPNDNPAQAIDDFVDDTDLAKALWRYLLAIARQFTCFYRSESSQ